MSSPKGSSNSASEPISISQKIPICILFGRPGSGKTTVATTVASKTCSLSNTDKDYSEYSSTNSISSSSPTSQSSSSSSSSSMRVLHLDLDCCIPQWMKDNFSKGIYPTLEQRNEFALSACQYVLQEIHHKYTLFLPKVVLLSFSFVNDDLREYFAKYYEKRQTYTLHWILMDTSEKDANHRIITREGHFYENITDDVEDETSTTPKKGKEWDFTPVNIDHLCLDGLTSIQENADIVIRHMEQILASSN